MFQLRTGLVCVMAVCGTAAQPAAQTPPPPVAQQPPPPTSQPPQPPTTTVVGADGRMVSLIFLRADAENVTRRIYDALLEREPTAPEHDESVAELQRGRLPQQLTVIVQATEFTDRVGGLPPERLVDQIFQGMLDRAPTPAETKTYLTQIKAKQYAPAMLKLITSDSFRKQVAQDRALSGNAPAKSVTPTPAVPERPGGKPGTATVSPPAASPPPSSVPVPPPPPIPTLPPGTTAEPPRAAEPERPPLRPSPFPTARNAPVSVPAAARPALSPEWAQILDCQADVVEQLRSDPPRHVQLRFDAPEISASTVRGTATDTLDERRLNYKCTGGRASYAYLDGRPRRAAGNTDFSNDAVKACHAAVTSALKRDRRGAAVSFETAGMMPTDSVLFVRGAGADASKPGEAQPFTYQCQWDGAAIVGVTYTLVPR